MDDEDVQGLGDLFGAPSSDIPTQVSVANKLHYIPVSIPPSISEILTLWSDSSSPVCRLGISPCDPASLNGMFEHTWGEWHTEQPTRLTAIIQYLHDNLWLRQSLRWQCFSGRMATDEEIRLVHSEIFLRGFLAVERGESVDELLSMRTLSYANANYTFRSVGPVVARACRIAAGTVIDLVSAVVHGDIDFGFALVRPAGHHSSVDRVGTFCGLNSVAIAAVHAVRVLNIKRVLILDWDVHRSGGTEEILARMPSDDGEKYRLIDLYAAFGSKSSTASTPSNCSLIDLFDKGRIPGDVEYLDVFDSKVLPDIRQFRPSLILISAGYDAAQGEAEECARLTEMGYFRMTQQLKDLNIPLVFVLEGGYRQQSLVQSTAATLSALLQVS